MKAVRITKRRVYIRMPFDGIVAGEYLLYTRVLHNSFMVGRRRDSDGGFRMMISPLPVPSHDLIIFPTNGITVNLAEITFKIEVHSGKYRIISRILNMTLHREDHFFTTAHFGHERNYQTLNIRPYSETVHEDELWVMTNNYHRAGEPAPRFLLRESETSPYVFSLDSMQGVHLLGHQNNQNNYFEIEFYRQIENY